VCTSINVDVDLCDEARPPFEDVSQNRRLISKRIYLTVTIPHIIYVVGLVSPFMNKFREIHWKVALRILTYIKGSPDKGLMYKKHGRLRIEGYSNSNYAWDKRDRKSTFHYCTYVGGNLVTWSRKQNVVSRSSVEAKSGAITHTTYEMMWLSVWMFRCLCSVITRLLFI